MNSIKPGVDISGIKPEMVIAYSIVASVYDDHGVECIITSGRDGEHMKGSLHYEGLALDFRTRNVPKDILKALVTDIITALGAQFDVVLKPTHLHVEFDP